MQLGHFLQEGRGALHVVGLDHVVDGLFEVHVFDHWDVDSREEVLHDRVEQRDVVVQELRDVRVFHGLDEHDVLLLVGVGSFEHARHD